MKTNHEWTRIDQKTDRPPSTTSGAKMLLQFGALGVTMSWDEGFPGARASRPHKTWYSLTHLLDPDRTATTPWLCFGRTHAIPAGSVAGCRIAGKLSDNPRERMRAGRPRSRGVSSRWCSGGYPVGKFSESRRAPFGKLPFVREPRPPRRGGSFESETIGNR